MSEQKMNSISVEEFDRIFDEGVEGVTRYLDLSSIRRPGREAKRVNVDFPAWMVEALDREAAMIGITRQALIKTVINDHLKSSL